MILQTFNNVPISMQTDVLIKTGVHQGKRDHHSFTAVCVCVCVSCIPTGTTWGHCWQLPRSFKSYEHACFKRELQIPECVSSKSAVETLGGDLITSTTLQSSLSSAPLICCASCCWSSSSRFLHNKLGGCFPASLGINCVKAGDSRVRSKHKKGEKWGRHL